MGTGLRTYPVNLLLEGRRCLVVGGGHVAARKAEGLVGAGAAVHVVASVAGPEVRALDVTIDERPYVKDDLSGCVLAISATGDPAVEEQVFRDGLEAGVLVNGADDPVHCMFTLPAVARRGAIQLTVSTGGRSPALSTWLRDRLATHLGEDDVTLLELLAEERDRLRAAGVATEGLDWRGALESGMLEEVGSGRIDSAKERLRACLSSSSD